MTGWVRSGSDPTICQVTTNNFISPTHSIMVNDNDASNYGEWDYDLSLVGLANPGDALNLRYQPGSDARLLPGRAGVRTGSADRDGESRKAPNGGSSVLVLQPDLLDFLEWDQDFFGGAAPLDFQMKIVGGNA